MTRNFEKIGTFSRTHRHNYKRPWRFREDYVPGKKRASSISFYFVSIYISLYKIKIKNFCDKDWVNWLYRNNFLIIVSIQIDADKINREKKSWFIMSDLTDSNIETQNVLIK